MNSQILDWPDELPRTDPTERESTSKFSTNFRSTKSDLKDEMRRMDVDQWRLSDVTGSGGDPGVVVRWRDDGGEYAVACDRYEAKKSNLRATLLWIKETRKREDRPVETGKENFAAAKLPSGDEAVVQPDAMDPHVILGVPADAGDEQVEDAFREKATVLHPDQNDGDGVAFRRLKWAREEMKGS